MLDFYEVKERNPKKGVIEIYPDFKVGRSTDLMIRGKAFYAIWDEQKGLWSQDEYDVRRLVDQELMEYRKTLADEKEETIKVKLMAEFSNKMWLEYRNWLSRLSDNSTQLDTKLTFLNTEVKKKDHVSRRLPYNLEAGSYDAFEEIISTLYDPEEREKLEWVIGAIVAGDAKDIQKFIVLYGEAGTGKGTIINIITKLFDGYYTTFNAKALASSNNTFATEVFRNNPLVAIQHDGDLSRIEDNTLLNSIISHEPMTMNEKYKPGYTARSNCFLFMGTNQPVKITDGRSGIIRRLIDVRPSGRKIPTNKYMTLTSQIDFELGAIAFHCLEVYKKLGKNYYAPYRPIDMMAKTDFFFNFVEDSYFLLKEQDGISLTQAYDIFKEYCGTSTVEVKLPKYKFREELKNYFSKFSDVARIDGKQVRSYYSGFLTSKFVSGREEKKEEEKPSWLVLDKTESIFDDFCSQCPAQYALSQQETPSKKWIEVTTKLEDIKTSRLHYVVVPLNHIVIDFDIKDESGKKSVEKNMEAASKWPPTYAEFSKSGLGLHLHYIYEGNTDLLSSVFDEGIEIKVFRIGKIGPAALRRKLTKCNSYPITTINSGLPLKEVKPVINLEGVKSEKSLRELIRRNLKKEIHPGTKPSIDFIKTILDEVYKSGLAYDVTDLRPAIYAFAGNSTNQAEYCLDLVDEMKFQSASISEVVEVPEYTKDDLLVYFDVEVFPNLFVVAWKYPGDDCKCFKMFNPSHQEIEKLMQMKLIGFNCRRYDNHILYARYVGYTNEQLYILSQRIIENSRNSMFGEAYNISYTDVYDFASAANKKSLKKFEIELGIHHQELGLPWDQPVPENLWEMVADYCCNDVIATEKVMDHLSGDWAARKILAELSGLSVNDTTNAHATKIIFGDNKKPQNEFIYTDLSIMFPGYRFEAGKSTYRGEEVGEGGYVYAEPGFYQNVAVLDVASMHPSSIEALNLFGTKYTARFSEIKNARIAVKHNDRDKISKVMNGRLVPVIERADKGEFKTSDLSTALKTVVNSVYGLTDASFDNPFRDIRNIDNVVAKRGALFMIDLKNAVQAKGFIVAHIKTDSIKIPDATPEIIDFVCKFGLKYGYTFEIDDGSPYDKLCLINKAVYIARKTTGKEAGKWSATGAEFDEPYVYKTLFSREPITLQDYSQTKSVTSALYLDMNEGYPEGEHNYIFIGKVGAFVPIKPGKGGGLLVRKTDDKFNSATGTKGYRWLEVELVKVLGKEDDIDLDYYRNFVDEAKKDIFNFVDFDTFIS
jgi:Family of unknown function (DUF5906)